MFYLTCWLENVSYQLWWLVKSRLAWQAPISATISQQLFPGWNEEHILFFSLYFYLSLCLCFPGLVFVSASFCVSRFYFYLSLSLSVFSRFYFCLSLFFLCWLFVIVLSFISNLSFMPFSAIYIGTVAILAAFIFWRFINVLYVSFVYLSVQLLTIISFSYSLKNCFGISFFLPFVSLSINPHI